MNRDQEKDSADQKSQRADNSKAAKINDEAAADKQDLVLQVRRQVSDAKAGRSTGITSDFGKPELSGGELSEKRKRSGSLRKPGRATGEFKKRKTTSSIEKRRKSQADGSLEKPVKHEEQFLTRSELNSRLKQWNEKLKAGSHSGITKDFGKPVLIERNAGDKPVKAAEVTREPADSAKDQKAVESATRVIREATKRDHWIDTGTDERSIYSALGSLNKSQRQQLEREYEKRYGIGLRAELRGEMTGAELDRALNLLDRKDGKPDDAGRLHSALIERGQLVSGRNNSLVEADIRVTIATMNSRQIDDLRKEYRARYGEDPFDAMKKDSHLSEDSKKFIEVYAKGTDKRTAQDMTGLLTLSCENRQIDLFKEACKFASPEDREKFMADGGKDKLGQRFLSTDLDEAQAYIEHGKLDSASQVRANTSILGDNEKAIEATLKGMSENDRERYLWGKHLQRDPAGESDYDKKALSYYKDLHDALDSAGNSTEMARWEDLIANKGGSLIGRLTEQRGIGGHHTRDGVLSVVENMTKDDWQKLKSDSDYRNEVRTAMRSFMSNEEVNAAEKIIDRKLTGASFEKSSDGRRALLETISDNDHWYSTDKDNVLSALTKMSKFERAEYESNPGYRTKLDTALDEALGKGPHRDAARYMLERAPHGKPPGEDVVVRIYKMASALDVDEVGVVAELQRSMKDDPRLRERILHPKSQGDREFVADLTSALKTALDPGEFESLAAPLLTEGGLSIRTQTQLNKGTFSDNKQAIIESLASVSATERGLLLNADSKNVVAAQLKEEIFGGMTIEERQLAESILKQSEVKSEDKIRMSLLGIGQKPGELQTTLQQMPVAERVAMLAAYEKKFGEPPSLLLSRFSPEEQSQLKGFLRSEHVSAREEFNEMRDRYYDSRTGILGQALVDSVWDGTGAQLDNSVSGYARAMARSSAQFAELPPEKRQQFAEKVGEALTLYRESKEAAADLAVDGLLLAAALIAAPETGGVSLGYLLAAGGLTGATLTVSIRAAALGDNYDWNTSAVSKDVLRGFVNGSTSVFGPAEVAKMLKIGEQVATRTATGVLTRAAERGLKSALKDGAEELLEKQVRHMVHTAVAEGKFSIDKIAIMKVAEQAVSKELAVEARHTAAVELAYALQESLETELRDVGKQTAKQAFKEIGLNAAASTVGGASTGMVDGVTAVDSRKNLGDNLRAVAEATGRGAVTGSVIGIGLTSIKHLGIAMFSNMRGDAPQGPAVHSDWYKPDPLAPMIDYKQRRTYNIGDKQYSLEQRVDKSPWFYKSHPGEVGAVTVHVNAGSAAELEEIQKKLIPALEDPKSPLHRLVADYGTLDPRFGSGDWGFDEWLKLPDGKRYDGIGFRIAASKPEEALEVQREIERLLGHGGDNSVGKRSILAREYYQPAFNHQGGFIGPHIDDEILSGLKKRIGAPSNERLTEVQLRELESLAGVEPGLVRYDRDGKLALYDIHESGLPRGGLRSFVDEMTDVSTPVDYYLPTPFQSGTSEKGLRSRAAFDSLSKLAGVDPISVLIKRK